LLLGGVALAAPGPKPARPVHEKGPAEIWQPMTEAMQRLGLTDLQRRILTQVFHQYVYETPAAVAPDAPLAVQIEPAVPGGLYRMGPVGDLPVRLQVHVRTKGKPDAIRLRYLVQDFYGRKVAGACGVAVVRPPAEGTSAQSAFGLLAPPGPVPDDLLAVAHRLGARHLAMDWDGTKGALEAVREAGLVPAPVVPIRIPQRRPAQAVLASTTAEAIAPLAEAVGAWYLGRRPVLERDSLAESVASYRQTVSGLLEAVRRGGSPAGLWVGTTPAVLASVLSEGRFAAGRTSGRWTSASRWRSGWTWPTPPSLPRRMNREPLPRSSGPGNWSPGR